MKRISSFLLAIVLFAGLVLTGAPTAHAASAMTVSDALIEIIKKEEGFAAKPYWDYGQYTVGYGTRCPDDMLEEYLNNGISEKEAETLLRNYLTAFENEVNKKLLDKHNVSLTQNQFDALVTFTYNLGTAWLSDTTSNLHKAIRNGATGSDLIWAFSLWCNAGGQIQPGLIRRRLCEANMYLNGEYSMTKPSNYCFVYYNANGGSVSYRIQGYDSNEGVAPRYTPTYSGHTFQGWYTQQTGGSKVTVLTKELSGTTLYARWDGSGSNNEVETKPEKSVNVTVTATDVNLRKGPGTNYSIVGTANKGDKLVITETASGTGYEWGKAGEKWIALKFTNYADAVKELEKEEETTVPETTVPETTVPETTVPETTVPETTVPETTVPETTVPETTVPETTVPETTVPKETKVTGTVKANGGLAVRKGPGTGYGAVKYLANGSKVTVTEQKKVGSMTWGKINEGWISMTYVVLDKAQTTTPETTVPETTKPATQETTLTGTVKASGGLSVRKDAGTSYARVKFIYSGTKVTITKTKMVGNTKWGYIGSGWVSMDYVVLDSKTEAKPTVPETTAPEATTPAKPETSNTQTGKVKVGDALSVRKGAGTTYAVVKYLYNGTKVTITEVKEVSGTKWGYMGSGWICMDYVVLDQQTSVNNGDVKTVTADCLNVRQSASTSAKIVGYYYQGAKVTITETTTAGGTKWGKTSKGWICMDYVK